MTNETLTPGTLMAAELAEQPAVLGRLVARHADDRERVRAALPSALAGTVLLARGSSDNVAVYGRYLIEMASGRPAGLAAPSVHTRYQAEVDYAGYLVVALSQSGATPEVVETAASMRRAGAVVIGIANEPGSALTQVCDLTLLTEAGPELAVPATKTVTAQMLAVAAIAAAYDSSLVAAADLSRAARRGGIAAGRLGCVRRLRSGGDRRRTVGGRTAARRHRTRARLRGGARDRAQDQGDRAGACRRTVLGRPAARSRSPRWTPGCRSFSSPAASGSRPTRRR